MVLENKRVSFLLKEFESASFEQLQLLQAWIGEYCQARIRVVGLESGLLEETKKE